MINRADRGGRYISYGKLGVLDGGDGGKQYQLVSAQIIKPLTMG